MPPTVRSFLLAALALLAGAVVFACAGLVLRNGPSAQSVAFCQVFLLGAAASGFTFMLFSKVAPRQQQELTRLAPLELDADQQRFRVQFDAKAFDDAAAHLARDGHHVRRAGGSPGW